MRRLFMSCLVLLAFAAMLLVVPLHVSAEYNPLGDKVGCGDPNVALSAVCRSTGGDPLNGPNGAFIKITRLVALAAGFAAIIIIVLAGIRYITSNGAADQISKSKQTIIYAVVGLVVIIVAQAVITYIIGRI